MKMTFQPKKRSRSKVHGFRARMSTPGGRKVLAAKKEQKEENSYQHRPHICGLFFYKKVQYFQGKELLKRGYR